MQEVGGECCGYVGSERSVLLRCTTCDLLTEADKSSEWWRRARGFIAVSERGRSCCSLSSLSVL